MTTPPLDLPALRAKLRITKVTDNAEALALLDRVEELERQRDMHIDSGRKLLDERVELQAMTRRQQNEISLERMRAEAAERDLAAVTVSRDGWKTRAEAAEKAVERVRELHTKEKHGVQHHCGECLQDDNTGSWEYVEWPCSTITALDGTP